MEKFIAFAIRIFICGLAYHSIQICGYGWTSEKIDCPIYDLVLSMALRYFGKSEGHKLAGEYKEDKIGVVVFQPEPEKIASYLD